MKLREARICAALAIVGGLATSVFAQQAPVKRDFDAEIRAAYLRATDRRRSTDRLPFSTADRA